MTFWLRFITLLTISSDQNLPSAPAALRKCEIRIIHSFDNRVSYHDLHTQLFWIHSNKRKIVCQSGVPVHIVSDTSSLSRAFFPLLQVSKRCHVVQGLMIPTRHTTLWQTSPTVLHTCFLTTTSSLSLGTAYLVQLNNRPHSRWQGLVSKRISCHFQPQSLRNYRCLASVIDGPRKYSGCKVVGLS